MPLGDPCRLGGLGELSRELRAIIMKCVLDTHRQYRLREIKGLGCPQTPVARYREGEANTGALVTSRTWSRCPHRVGVDIKSPFS